MGKVVLMKSLGSIPSTDSLRREFRHPEQVGRQPNQKAPLSGPFPGFVITSNLLLLIPIIRFKVNSPDIDVTCDTKVLISSEKEAYV